jgi:hypothetical protein
MSRHGKPKPQVDVDPEVEQLAALIQRSGLSDSAIALKVGRKRILGMAPETVRNVRELAVRRPQNYTLQWIGWALGFRRVWEKL